MRNGTTAAERKRKHKKLFRVIMEIVFMTLGILCSIMPYPFPLLVPIGIGTIRIISNAVKREKEPLVQPPIVYCNGVQEPHTKAELKMQTTKKRVVKALSAATPPVQIKPARGKTANQINREQKQGSKTKEEKAK